MVDDVLGAGGAGRDIPARRAGASPVIMFVAPRTRGPRRADCARWGGRGRGNPATGPGERQLKRPLGLAGCHKFQHILRACQLHRRSLRRPMMWPTLQKPPGTERAYTRVPGAVQLVVAAVADEHGCLGLDS